MRNRDCVKKCLALMLSVSMAIQPGCIALAEEPEQTEVQSIETEQTATEAVQTEAPTTEAPETEAPATEAPETEAPATEAPETEATAVQAETQYTFKYQIYTWNEAQKRHTKLGTKTMTSDGAMATIPMPDASSTPDVTVNGKKYVFKGWRVGRIGENNEIQTELQFAAGTAVTADVSELGNKYLMIYAVYAEQASSYTYTLNYDGNAEDVTGVPDAQTETNKNGSAVFEVSAAKPTRIGYIFQGWAESADATEVKYAAGDEIRIAVSEENQTKTLYAVWKSAMVGPQEDTEINVYVEYMDSSLEKGYRVDNASKKTVKVTCQNKTEHSKYTSHQVKYNDVVKAADVSSFTVEEGWEIVGISRAGGANQAVFALDNTFMQGGVQPAYNDFYLVAKKKPSITLNKKTLTLEFGSQETLSAELVKVEEIAWTSSDEIVVTVAADGTITAVGLGTAVVICADKADENVKATCEVTVVDSTVLKAAVKAISGTSANVTWNKVPSASGYQIYRMEVGNGDYKLVKTVSAAATWRNDGLTAGKTYRYYVQAYRMSEGKKVAIKKSPAASCVMPKIAVSPSKLTLEYGKNTTLKAVKTGVTAVNWTSSDTKIVKVSSNGTITAVGLGTAVVTCVDKTNKNVKATCTVTAVDSTVLKVTVNAISGTSAKVTWNKVPSADGYQIYRMETGNGVYKLVRTIAAATTWWNDGLTAGKTYRYYVQAYRMSEGKKVAIKKSPAASCVMPKIVVSPSKLTLEYGKSTTLKAAKTGVTAVKWISSDAKIAKVSSNGTITAVGLGTATITCVSQKNQTVKASCAVTVKDSTVLRLQASAGKTSNKLSWNKVPSASGYMVYGALCGNSFKLLKTVSAASTSWTQNGLASGKGYRYRVKAYRIVNGQKVVQKTSNEVHSATLGGKYTNVKSISVNEKNVTLKAGASKKIIVKAVLNNAKGTLLKHTAELVYSTSNSKVATVSKAGVITAVGKGSCTIYVRAENGVFTTVTVTVK